MGLFYCVNGIQSIRFQLCIAPFSLDKQRVIQLPPAYTEAGAFFHPSCKTELQARVNAIPKEMVIESIPYHWVTKPHKPDLLLYHDRGSSPLQQTLRNALNTANMKGFNIALMLFRSGFGNYHAIEGTQASITIEECGQFVFGRHDIDIHIVLASQDTIAYELFKKSPKFQEECAPNFMTLQEA